MAALEYWLWLSAAAVSPRAKAAVIEHFGDAETAFLSPAGSFSQIPDLSPQEGKLLEQRDFGGISKIQDACDEQGIRILTMQDAAYPGRLRNIYAPPVVLYIRGKLPQVDREALIAVIGTRDASVYGRRMGRDLAYQICLSGGMVVSGLTRGVDEEAARGALLAEGFCVGVLGTAHDQARGFLPEDLAQRGALISEYPPGTRSQKHFFRERNRIAAGISVGVVVVEAPEHSGTRLFADEAAEQGKEIFAVPGYADAENSAGSHFLIQEGAKLVTCGWDVLCEFEALFPNKLHPTGKKTAPPPQKEETSRGKAEETDGPARAETEKAVDKQGSKGYIDLREQLASLPENQLRILTAMDKGATHVDDIIERTGLPTPTVLGQLTLLQIKGFVRREPGQRFSLNITKK